MQTTSLYQPAMSSAVQKVKAGGWQRVVAWCAGAALCLWLVSTIFSPGRPAASTTPAQELGAPSTGPSSQRLLESRSDTDAAHAAILQRFLQLYGSAPPRASEIAVASGPQQPILGGVDDQPDERPENSDDTRPPGQLGRSDLPVATPHRELDQDAVADGGPPDVQAPEAPEGTGPNSDALDPNAAAAVLGEEQTREEVADPGDSPELSNRGQSNDMATDSEAPQGSVRDTKSVTQEVNGDVFGIRYESPSQWPDNRGLQQVGNAEALQRFPQDTPTGYSRQSNEVSRDIDGRWRDSGTVEAYVQSPTQQQTLQERTVLIQPPSRNVYVPEAMMRKNRQEYQPLIGSKNEGPSSLAREEIQQPVSYYSRSPEQFNLNRDYRNSLGVSSNNIVYPKKFTAQGTDSNEGRYNAQETSYAQLGDQKLFGRKYLSISEAADVHDQNTGTVDKGSIDVEGKATLQNVALDFRKNEDDTVLHVTSKRDEDSNKGNSYEVNNQDVGETPDHNNIQKIEKTEVKVPNNNKNVVEEKPPVTKRLEESKSVGENVNLEAPSIGYKQVANATKLKKECVIQKETGVIKEKSGSMNSKLKCPEGDLVSVQDGGRLGNKLWEYAAVWALPRVLPELNKTAVVPRSLLKALSKVFHNLTLPALEDIPEDCPARQRLEASEPVKRWRLEPMSRAVADFAGRPLLLHRWIVLAEPVLARLQELRDTEFRLRPELAAGAQAQLWALRRRSGVPDRSAATFVGVHVRRTDFSSWLPRVYNRSLADASYFSAGMSLCRARARLWRGGRALFAVASDDPAWCERWLADGSSGGSRDVLVARGASPEQDLALLAACNQSLIDYGTFGQWAALLAGGPAVSLRLDPHVDEHLARLPGWTLA